MPAPKGNTNALKHGFYSKQFRQSEMDGLSALQAVGFTDLASEIALLRVSVARCFEQVSHSEEVDWIATLSAIGLAAIRIATILRTQKILEGDQGAAVAETIKSAIAQVAKDWK
jgi:uncharacterized protein YjcR